MQSVLITGCRRPRLTLLKFMIKVVGIDVRPGSKEARAVHKFFNHDAKHAMAFSPATRMELMRLVRPPQLDYLD